MKKLVSVSVFVIALLIGIFLPINTPTIYEKTYPTFSPNEINLLLGKKVINESNIRQQRSMKFPLDDVENTSAEILQNGETGRIVNLQRVMEGKDVNLQKIMKNCNLLIKWDKKNKDGIDMFSCYGRFSSRAFLEFE
ncbi:hypothetical protein BH20ACI1_BH20ACI1_02770 [soil metagenome]